MKLHHRALIAAGLVAPACAPAAPAAHRSRSTESAGPGAAEAPSASAPGPETTSAEPVAPASGSAGPSTTVTTLVVSTTSSARTPATTIVVPVPATAGAELLPELVDEGLTDDEWWEAQPGYHVGARDVLLACIRSYEQNDDPRKGPTGYASDTGNGFYGAYQFTLGTWQSVGGSGNPAHAPAAEQDARAWALYQSRGLAPWPTPARRCS